MNCTDKNCPNQENWTKYLTLGVEYKKIEQENRQLKEELRKYQVLQHTPKELEIELNKSINLREIVETLRGFVDSDVAEFSGLAREILGIKEKN